MKTHKILTALVLALALLLASASAMSAEEAAIYDHLGETLPDFTVSTIDGGSFTLSEVLKEKEMVLINLWASWCGPCEMEFPYLEEAYELYKDQVEVIALSVEENDTDDVLTAYVAEHGMTFPVGNDATVGLGPIYATAGIPTTLVVDRFGTVCFIEIGSQPSTGAFTSLFEYFSGDDYTQSEILEELPPIMPTVPAADPAELSAALGVENVANSADETVWPMIPAEKDGRSALVSTNAAESGTVSGVYWTASFQEGEGLSVTFKTSTEAAMDLLWISVDGERVKAFGGEHDWTEWVLPMEAGEHEIALEYVKDYYGEDGEDSVWLDTVAVVPAGEVAAKLASQPAYPVADEFVLELATEDAREIVFAGDEEGMLEEYFTSQSYWIVPGETAEAVVYLTADIDPEAAFAYSNYDGETQPVLSGLAGYGYNVSTVLDSVETTGYSYTNLYAYPSADVVEASEIRGLMFFTSEENVNAFIEEMKDEGMELTWSYADGSAPSTTEAAEGEAPNSEYTVTFVDQNGEPVPGCIINFCTDEACVPTVAGEDGVATFSGAPYAYHLQVIKVPEGYEFDTTQEFTADPNGGEMSFTVTKK